MKLAVKLMSPQTSKTTIVKKYLLVVLSQDTADT